MVEMLICAIAEKIRGTGYEVYTEQIGQNLMKPCFFLECESVERMELIGGRFFVRAWIKLNFENDVDEKKYEEQKMIHSILSALGQISVNGQAVNGRKIGAKHESGSLVIRAMYDMWTKEIKDDVAYMEKIEVKGEI